MSRDLFLCVLPCSRWCNKEVEDYFEGELLQHKLFFNSAIRKLVVVKRYMLREKGMNLDKVQGMKSNYVIVPLLRQLSSLTTRLKETEDVSISNREKREMTLGVLTRSNFDLRL